MENHAPGYICISLISFSKHLPTIFNVFIVSTGILQLKCKMNNSNIKCNHPKCFQFPRFFLLRFPFGFFTCGCVRLWFRNIFPCLPSGSRQSFFPVFFRVTSISIFEQKVDAGNVSMVFTRFKCTCFMGFPVHMHRSDPWICPAQWVTPTPKIMTHAKNKVAVFIFPSLSEEKKFDVRSAALQYDHYWFTFSFPMKRKPMRSLSVNLTGSHSVSGILGSK